MRNVLPKRAQFLLSDDIREETSGKMTIIGYYTDAKVFVTTIPNAPAPPAGVIAQMPQFCMSCILSEGVGQFPILAEIRGPSGQLIATFNAQQVFIAGATTTIALRGLNVTFPEFGKYECTVTVKTKKFTYSFELVQGPPPSAASMGASANRL
jgi:hypothetical protein